VSDYVECACVWYLLGWKIVFCNTLPWSRKLESIIYVVMLTTLLHDRARELSNLSRNFPILKERKINHRVHKDLSWADLRQFALFLPHQLWCTFSLMQIYISQIFSGAFPSSGKRVICTTRLIFYLLTLSISKKYKLRSTHEIPVCHGGHYEGFSFLAWEVV
jgi:hypothetical protein